MIAEYNTRYNDLRQDLETECTKLAILKFWGVLPFRGDHNILRILPCTFIYLLK